MIGIYESTNERWQRLIRKARTQRFDLIPNADIALWWLELSFSYSKIIKSHKRVTQARRAEGCKIVLRG